MRKLIKGIVEFQNNILPDYAEKFAQLALGQSPDTLFIACSDSRVVPNLFASTDPGDLFVVRNIGNLIPICAPDGHSISGEAEGSAIEFAILKLNVSDIVICGHSECGAMYALLDGREKLEAPNLRAWLRHGEPSLATLNETTPTLSKANHLSQINVLEQIEHLKTYPVVRERLAAGTLRLHGWWFDIKSANVLAYDDEQRKFVEINEKTAPKLLESAR